MPSVFAMAAAVCLVAHVDDVPRLQRIEPHARAADYHQFFRASAPRAVPQGVSAADWAKHEHECIGKAIELIGDKSKHVALNDIRALMGTESERSEGTGRTAWRTLHFGSLLVWFDAQGFATACHWSTPYSYAFFPAE